jgi:hypothetical protein
LSTTAQTGPRLTVTPERTSPVVVVTAASASLPREPFVKALSLDQQPSRFSFLLAAIRNRDHKLERLFQADVVKTPFIRQTRVPVFGLWNGRLQLGAFANTRNFENTLLDPLCSDRFRRIGAPRLRAVGPRRQPDVSPGPRRVRASPCEHLAVSHLAPRRWSWLPSLACPALGGALSAGIERCASPKLEAHLKSTRCKEAV